MANYFRSGRWFSVILQLFPDGTCGLAIDGEPVARSSGSLNLSVPFKVRFEGNSVGAPMLIGPLEVWTGSRNDVDWSNIGVDQ